MKTRAIVIERYGRPEVLADREVPLRDPRPGEIHLAVEAAGVNFADLLMRVGLYSTAPRPPFSPGFEVAGRVARTGAGVEGWREGDRAVALLRNGGYASNVVVPAGQAFPFPGSLTPVQVAALPVVFLTASLCLFEVGHGRQGETALVLGAGGGVGTAAVQLAVEAGLRVVGTAGAPAKREYVTDELGAAACFDSQGDWEQEVRAVAGERGIDLALDPVGGRATAACRRLLAPLGRLVFYGLSDAARGTRRSWVRAAIAWARTPRFHPLSLVEPNIGVLGVHLLHLGPKTGTLKVMMEEILQKVSEGSLRPVVDRTFPLDRDGAVAAHTYLHERRNLGKVVLRAAGGA